MSVTAALGYVAGAHAARIRKREVPDLAMVKSIPRSTGAGMFTTNRVKAAPVLVSTRHLETADPQAVVINSGVANAATGPRGELDAVATAADTARLLDVVVEEVIVLSTGLIGVPLPLAKVRSGLTELVPKLSRYGGSVAAEAIMTTDTRPKTSVVQHTGFTIGGMAKGAGMIHPSLATMLAVITTDYPLRPGEAIEFLGPAVEESFNRISVDGECSTNDAVILLANGASEVSRDDPAFSDALGRVAADLARQIVADGEGMTVVIQVAVEGAGDDNEAKAVAARVATSSLVKTAAFGKDPNWGRVVAAVGSAKVGDTFAEADVDQMSIAFNGTKLFDKGMPTHSIPDLSPAVLTIDIDLGLGPGSSHYLSTDLSYDYVEINAEYTT